MNCLFGRDKKNDTIEETYCYCYVCREKIAFNRLYYIYNLYGRTFLLCSRNCVNNFVHKS